MTVNVRTRHELVVLPHAFGGVRFAVLWPEGEDGLPDWERDTYVASRHVPGGNRTITQVLGRGPLTVTWRLLFGSIVDYRTFRGLVHRTGTLEISEGMQSVAGTVVMVAGVMVEQLSDVLLVSVGRALIDASGEVEADATFQRSSG